MPRNSDFLMNSVSAALSSYYNHILVPLGRAYSVFYIAALFLTVFVVLKQRWELRKHNTRPLAGIPADPAVVITLVHGTFFPRAAWMKSTSPFCRKLEEKLQTSVAFFQFHPRACPRCDRVAPRIEEPAQEVPCGAPFRCRSQPWGECHSACGARPHARRQHPRGLR